MKKKLFLAVLIIVLLSVFTGNLFAQEDKGHIKPTFGIGYGIPVFLNVFLDVDFVSPKGFTLGIQADMLVAGGPPLYYFPIGLGYTYDNGNFAVGGKLMLWGFAAIDGGGLNIDITTTWWIKETFGLTAIVDFLIIFGGGVIPLIKIGTSLKI